MKVTHVGSTTSSGSGVGLMRYHQALLKAGLDSRVLVATSFKVTPGERIEQISKNRPSILNRLRNRIGLAADAETRMYRRLEDLNQDAVFSCQYELFSLPFSQFCPEQHPWVQEADVINLHWVAGVLDWPRFFATINKPTVITLHDQQPYLGGFHYAIDAETNPHLAELEAEVRAI